MRSILPIVVPDTYFDLPPAARAAARPGREAFGIVRPVGQDLFSLLVNADGDLIKNVHEEELAAAGLDRATAERMAADNLSKLAEGDRSIRRQVNRTPSGFHYAVWSGGRFTSSCLLWPGLHEWASRELESERVIAMVPQVQLMCVAARGNAEFRSAIKGYMENVVEGMKKQISTEWFEVTPDGLAPLGTD